MSAAVSRKSPGTNPQRPGPPRNTPVRLVTFNSPKGVPRPYAGVMKTLVSKDALNRMALCLCFLSATPIAQGAEPNTISMTADRWQTKENAEFLRQLGFYHGLMRLNSGRAALKDITFSDGTIEFDVNTIGRGMPGIAFREQDENNFELLYLRPDPSCPAFRACMQYTPQTHGVSLWDFFPQYQTRAPLRENGWNHIKMVVSGRRMNVYVNDAPSPTLEVGRLEGDAMKGGLHLQGPATFANMVITPDAVEGLSPEPARDPLDGDRGLVRNWRLSTFSALPNGKDPLYNEMPDASARLEDDQHGAEGPGKYQPRIRQAPARTKPSRSMAEDDHNFRQEADEEGGHWMDARTVGVRERETGVCRPELL